MDRCWMCKRPAVSELQAVIESPAGEDQVMVGLNACREHRHAVALALVRIATGQRAS